jgi:hypothetical protein
VAQSIVDANSTGKTAAPTEPVAAPGAQSKPHQAGDHSKASRSRRWRVRPDQLLVVVSAVLIILVLVVASQLRTTTVIRDLIGDIWTTPDLMIVVGVLLGLIALIAGTVWPTTYLPTVWAVAPLIPGLAAIAVVATYLIAPVGAGAAAFVVGSEIAAAIAIIGAMPLRMLATVRVAQTRSYWELRRRSEQLRKRLKVIEEHPSRAGWGTSKRMALDEANKQLDEVKRALLRPASRSRTNGLEWVSAMGYVSLWRRVDRAEECLIELEPNEALLADALHDRLRLSGAGIKGDQLEAALTAAVNVIDKHGFEMYFAPTMQSQKVDATTNQPSDKASAPPNEDVPADAPPDADAERLARAVVREVRHALNTFIQDSMEGIVRARNRLWRAILLTATTTFLLVGLAVLNDVPKQLLTGASVFFLVAAVVGLFNRLRLQAQSDLAVEDFNLFEARLVHTPLISGLAGVAGVILVAVVPAASTQNLPDLTKIFDISTNPFGLLVAAAFGLAPGRIIGPLEDQTERLKGQLKAGKAAVESGSGGQASSDAATT